VKETLALASWNPKMGRIDVEAKYKPRDGSFSAERRKEIPHELESTSKITRK
jgi:hypothetical protein